MMACRDIQKAEAAREWIMQNCEGQQVTGEITVIHLDLSSLSSVGTCAQKVLEQEDHIHILINNAGQSYIFHCEGWNKKNIVFYCTICTLHTYKHGLTFVSGVMACPRAFTEDGYELQFGTNHLGHFLFTLILLPKIINSAPARIVNLSSKAHIFCKYYPSCLSYLQVSHIARLVTSRCTEASEENHVVGCPSS